ncbi:MAG TPA: hypothetical protein VME17_08985 [Bryobacteraceae bacterium]|nr:hypothetical protein [Bryobacteraceae bacterium]
MECTVALSTLDLGLKPFDQAIHAAVIVRASELQQRGEKDICFCEADSDLQPWDRRGEPKHRLVDVYDDAAVWVYGDFELRNPERPDGWPDSYTT